MHMVSSFYEKTFIYNISLLKYIYIYTYIEQFCGYLRYFSHLHCPPLGAINLELDYSTDSTWASSHSHACANSSEQTDNELIVLGDFD